MFEKLLEIMLAALLGAGGATLADTPFGTEGEDDATETTEVEEEDGDGPPDLERVAALVLLNVEAAQAHASAAQGHAEEIREWTSCIAEQAADISTLPRDDSFDPKVGCEEFRPATTPDGLPHGADDEASDEEAGPPSWAGGPPDWAGEGPGGGPGGDDSEDDNPNDE